MRLHVADQLSAETHQLADALQEASVGELEFSSEPVRSHSEDPATRVGFRPVRVRGVVLPIPSGATYVHATSPHGEAWYVVDQTGGDSVTISVASEAEARAVVLKLLRAAFSSR